MVWMGSKSEGSRLAGALIELFHECDAAFPGRSHESDGTVGDARHQAEPSSDHNAHVVDRDGCRVVTALDITHDPGICDAGQLAERLRVSKDKRLKYVISNRRIASFDHGWTWRPYNGTNAHTHHCHVSVRGEQVLFDDMRKWAGVTVEPIHKSKIAVAQVAEIATVGTGGAVSLASQLGDIGQNVQTVQTVVSSSGDILDKTISVGKNVPHGFWQTIVATLHEPVFIACFVLVSIALCSATIYWRWQMKKHEGV